MSSFRWPRVAWLFVCIITLPTNSARAADTVVVVVNKKAPALEHFAARELTTQFKRLSKVKIEHAAKLGDDVKKLHKVPYVLIGSPNTNPAVKQVLADKWPKLSEQGFVIKSFQTGKHQGVVVGGQTPAATLWAAYELGHRLGIRYVLREDIYPQTPIPLKLDALDVVAEPVLKTRTWRTINDFAIGPEAWGLADHKPLLRQLAKMKFNRLMLSVYPWQPFVHYEFRGVKKKTAMLWYGEQFPIRSGSPGRTAFQREGLFTNPDFAGKTDYQQMIDAGKKHVQGLIDAAHELGMTVGVSISPLEFPQEFAKALPGLKPSRGLKNLLAAPGKELAFDDPNLKDLVATKIRAYLEAYPQLDVLYLTLPEFPEWEEHVHSAWKTLVKRIGSGAPQLDDLIAQAKSRPTIASGDRGVRALKGNIVTLAFLHELLEDSQLLKRPDGKQVELVITAVDDALFPVIDKVLPAGAAALNFIDYTARRVDKNRRRLTRFPVEKVKSRLIMTLADDNVGVLPQTATRRLGSLMSQIRDRGWDGFSTRYWMLTELDPTVYFLSRAAWDRHLTARAAHDELFVPMTGKQSAADRLWLAFGHIEKATELIDQHDLGYSFPIEGMLMKHYRAEPIPDWWKELTTEYEQSMIELYRSHDASHPRSRRLLFYYAKRSEYVLDYLNTAVALRKAALAKKKGDREEAITQLETATEAIYNAIDTLSDVVRDRSDLGLIAVLNKYGYRPIDAEYQRLSGE